MSPRAPTLESFRQVRRAAKSVRGWTSGDQNLLQNTELSGGTPRESIHLAVDNGRTDHRHVISYSGSEQPIGCEINPGQAFINILGDISFAGRADPGPVSPQPVGFGASVHHLHVVVLNAFGADADRFGSAEDGTGALSGVLG